MHSGFYERQTVGLNLSPKNMSAEAISKEGFLL